MSSVLSLILIVLVLVCWFNPEKLGTWLRAVDNARFLELEQR
jgi:hypothetical protein